MAEAQGKPHAVRISSFELAIFNRQLASMVNSGLPLAPAIEALARDMKSTRLRQQIEGLQRSVESGASLSDALKRQGRLLPPLYVSLIEAGEKAGNLSIALNQIAEHSQRTARFKARMREMLIYPIAVISVAVFITLFLTYFIVPTFAEMFEGLGDGGELPAPTRLLLAVSRGTKENAIPVAVGIGIVVVLCTMARQSRGGRFLIDRIALAMPLFGKLQKSILIARFSGTLGALLRSGVTLPRALELVEAASGNGVMERAVGRMREEVAGGGQLSESMYMRSFIPYSVSWMVAEGERGGKLDECLLSLARSYDDLADHLSSLVFLFIEPMLLVVMGMIVGSVVISLFLPLIKLGGMIGG